MGRVVRVYRLVRRARVKRRDLGGFVRRVRGGRDVLVPKHDATFRSGFRTPGGQRQCEFRHRRAAAPEREKRTAAVQPEARRVRAGQRRQRP